MTGFYFKAGEFAQLCGVKKDTLLHYDHIGILTPEYVNGENGYRYYSAKQFYTFDLISALKKLGMSLQEIKAYLDQRNPEDFLRLLQERLEILDQERSRLDSIASLLEETILATQKAQTSEIGAPHLEYCPQEHYVSVDAPDYSHFDERQFLLRSRSLLRWARRGGSLAFPPGDIVRKESLLKEDFVEDYYYCRVSADAQAEEISIKPEGIYAVLYHRGNYETLESACRDLYHWVLAQRYKVIGNLYEEDLLHHLSTADPNQYVMRISIHVDVGEEAKELWPR